MENQFQTSFISFIEKHYTKILLWERISLGILLLGIFFYQFLQSNYTVFIVSGSILGAIAYFLLSYRFIEEENLETTGILNSTGFINFIYKLAYYSFAIGCLAMLGLVVDFKKGNILMVTSGLTLIAILLISLVTKLNDRTVIYNSSFYTRVLIFLGMLGYLGLVEYGKI